MSEVKLKRQGTWTVEESGREPTVILGGLLPGSVSLKRDGMVMHLSYAAALAVAEALKEATRITNQ